MAGGRPGGRGKKEAAGGWTPGRGIWDNGPTINPVPFFSPPFSSSKIFAAGVHSVGQLVKYIFHNRQIVAIFDHDRRFQLTHLELTCLKNEKNPKMTHDYKGNFV